MAQPHPPDTAQRAGESGSDNHRNRRPALDPHFSHLARGSGARTPACRVETLLDTLVGDGQSAETGRRHECRRGTQECVRHIVTTEAAFWLAANFAFRELSVGVRGVGV